MNIKEENRFAPLQIILFSILAFLIVPICAVGGSVNLFATILVPIIIAMVYLRFNFINTAFIMIISTVISAIYINPILSVQALILYGSIGLVLGYCFKKVNNPYKSFVILVTTTIVAILLIASLYTVVNKTSFAGMAQLYVDSVMKKVEYLKELYVSAGMSEVQLESLDIIKEIITAKNVLISLPGMIMALAIISSIINYIIGKKVSNKLGYCNIKQLKFSEIYVTNLLGALFIGLFAIGIIVSFKFVNIGEFLKYGSLGVLRMLLILNGLAAISYLFIKKLNKSAKRTFWLLAITVVLGANRVYALIGFIEMMFDFRKLDPFSLTKNRKSVR